LCYWNLVEFGEKKLSSLLSWFNNNETLLKSQLSLVDIQAVLVEFLTVNEVQAEWPRMKTKYKFINKYVLSLVLNNKHYQKHNISKYCTFVIKVIVKKIFVKPNNLGHTESLYYLFY
jgi:hypothetical protein